MARTAESLQNVWQKKFQEHTLNPFTSDPKLGIRYQRFDNPASWWFNPVNPDSLRLTKPAFNMLNQNKEIKNWHFKLSQPLVPRAYIQLEKHFTSPYYISGPKSVYVFDERDSIMLALHGSNLQQYLDNLAQNS
jgi:hypothetical protein